MKILTVLILAAAGCLSEIPGKANVRDGDINVPIVSSVLVPLASGAGASEVDGATVTLVDADGFALRGVASFDSTRGVLDFDPVRPMKEGTTYRISSDLEGADGTAIDFSFTTIANPVFSSTRFVPGTANANFYSEFDGDTTRFFGPGPDNVLLTPDDEVTDYRQVEERVGDIQFSVSYGSGDDGVLFTPDDRPSQYTKITYDGPLQVRNDFYRVGDDGLVDTADDQITQLRTLEHNEEGQRTSVNIFLDGGDGIVGSADDNLILVFVTLYDADGLVERSVGLEAGPDLELGTSDDIVPDGPIEIQHDDNGVEIGFDDGFTRSDHFVDEIGVRYRIDFYDGGFDGVSGTADDRIFDSTAYRVP